MFYGTNNISCSIPRYSPHSERPACWTNHTSRFQHLPSASPTINCVNNGAPTSISEHNPQQLSWLRPNEKFGVAGARVKRNHHLEFKITPIILYESIAAYTSKRNETKRNEKTTTCNQPTTNQLHLENPRTSTVRAQISPQ